MTLIKAQKAKEELDNIRRSFKVGFLSYNEAKTHAKVPLETVNEYLTKRAKDFGVTPRKINFSSIIR